MAITVNLPAGTGQPGDRVDEVTVGRHRCRPHVVVTLQRQEISHPPASDQGTADIDSAFDEGRHRNHQDRGVSEDRDQLPHGDRSLNGQPSSQPHHDGHEKRRHSQTDRLNQTGDAADPVTLTLQFVRLLTDPGRVDLLAAQPVQDTQTTDDVNDSARQCALLAAIRRAEVLQPSQRRPQDESQDQYPAEDHHRQRRRNLEQQHRDHHVRQGGPHPRPCHREAASDRPRITNPNGHHLSSSAPPIQGGTKPHGLSCHRRHRPIRGIHPHLRHRAVAPNPQPGQNRACDHQSRRPREHGVASPHRQDRRRLEREGTAAIPNPPSRQCPGTPPEQPSIAEVARDLGINEGTLGNWVTKYRNEHPISEELTIDERAKLKELEKEVRELRMERDFLKKAAAFFAKEQQ